MFRNIVRYILDLFVEQNPRTEMNLRTRNKIKKITQCLKCCQRDEDLYFE